MWNKVFGELRDDNFASLLMNRPFSVYLDLVRFIAAFLVYLYHSNQRFLTESILPASDYGHSSVMVFFVLSGFVIAFVTATKENTWVSYSASRMARVFSVTVPAIFLTVFLDAIGRNLYPEIYSGYPYDKFILRIGSSLAMLNEVWLLSITSFSNVPYWSICYEWWYYVTFAMISFLPLRIGIPLAIMILLLIGPKLILLAPIWWLGVLLYRWRRLQDLSIRWSVLFLVISVIGVVVYHASGFSDITTSLLKMVLGEELHRSLTFSKFFVGDYFLGVLVFLNFAGARNILATYGDFLLSIEKPVRFLANYTFTLYLLHQPLFLFWGAVIQGDPSGPWYWLTVTALMLLSIAIVGHFTENRRKSIRDFLIFLFARYFPDKTWATTSKAG